MEEEEDEAVPLPNVNAAILKKVKHFISYLWRIFGQLDILLLNLTSIGFTNFFEMPHL
jgi:hypothetical protein